MIYEGLNLISFLPGYIEQTLVLFFLETFLLIVDQWLYYCFSKRKNK